MRETGTAHHTRCTTRLRGEAPPFIPGVPWKPGEFCVQNDAGSITGSLQAEIPECSSRGPKRSGRAGNSAEPGTSELSDCQYNTERLCRKKLGGSMVTNSNECNPGQGSLPAAGTQGGSRRGDGDEEAVAGHPVSSISGSIQEKHDGEGSRDSEGNIHVRSSNTVSVERVCLEAHSVDGKYHTCGSGQGSLLAACAFEENNFCEEKGAGPPGSLMNGFIQEKSDGEGSRGSEGNSDVGSSETGSITRVCLDGQVPNEIVAKILSYLVMGAADWDDLLASATHTCHHWRTSALRRMFDDGDALAKRANQVVLKRERSFTSRLITSRALQFWRINTALGIWESYALHKRALPHPANGKAQHRDQVDRLESVPLSQTTRPHHRSAHRERTLHAYPSNRRPLHRHRGEPWSHLQRRIRQQRQAMRNIF